MSFRIVGTNHTSFTVSSLDRTLPFFLECLSFKLVSRAPRDPQIVQQVTGVEGADMEIAFVSGHGCTVELIEYKAPASKGRVEARPCDAGFAHIAFNVDDADAAVAEAARYNVVAINPPVAINAGPNRGRKVVYCRDADGVTFEFIEVKT
ncbi:MAG: bleomycin resistance protein [Betaproteobacteria bacterium]|nr:bleomycin resistance protein [Betaproteobacteria bacterium]